MLNYFIPFFREMQKTVLNRKLGEVSEALRQAEARNKGLGDELKEATKGVHGTRQELANLNNTISNLQAEKTHNQGLMKSMEVKLQVRTLNTT